MDFEIKRKERKALNFSLCSLTHRNARTIKLVSLRVRRIRLALFFGSTPHFRTVFKLIQISLSFSLGHNPGNTSLISNKTLCILLH